MIDTPGLNRMEDSDYGDNKSTSYEERVEKLAEDCAEEVRAYVTGARNYGAKDAYDKLCGELSTLIRTAFPAPKVVAWRVSYETFKFNSDRREWFTKMRVYLDQSEKNMAVQMYQEKALDGIVRNIVVTELTEGSHG